MANSRLRIISHLGLPNDHLVTDSVVLDEESVAKDLAADETNVPRGDVIDGLKYGLIVSICIWAVIFLTAYFVLPVELFT